MAKDIKVDPKYGKGEHSVCPFCGMYSALKFKDDYFSCRAFLFCGLAGGMANPEQRRTYNQGIIRDIKLA